MKICLLQPYLTPYRIGLFNELSRLLEGRLTVPAGFRINGADQREPTDPITTLESPRTWPDDFA